MSKKHSKKYFKGLNKAALRTCKKFGIYLDEYNEENNVKIDFHVFFVNVLMYSEEDYIKLITYQARQKAKKERNRKRNENPKPKQINQFRLVEKGIGDTEHPEYEKYWNIYTDYNNNFLGDDSITGKKSLKAYFIYKYGYNEDKALEESRKISKIIFKKNK